MILAYGHGSNPIVLIFGTLVVSGVLIMIRTAMRQAEGKSRYSRPAISARLPKPPTRPATDGETLKMLACSAWALYGTAVNQVTRDRVSRRIFDVKPGDFVMEYTSVNKAIRRGEDLGTRMGRLLEIRGEGDSAVHVVRMMDGRTTDWSNASFLAIPDRMDTNEWAREADLR
jgi:hypothetical protein